MKSLIFQDIADACIKKHRLDRSIFENKFSQKIQSIIKETRVFANIDNFRTDRDDVIDEVSGFLHVNPDIIYLSVMYTNFENIKIYGKRANTPKVDTLIEKIFPLLIRIARKEYEEEIENIYTP